MKCPGGGLWRLSISSTGSYRGRRKRGWGSMAYQKSRSIHGWHPSIGKNSKTKRSGLLSVLAISAKQPNIFVKSNSHNKQTTLTIRSSESFSGIRIYKVIIDLFQNYSNLTTKLVHSKCTIIKTRQKVHSILTVSMKTNDIIYHSNVFVLKLLKNINIFTFFV